jgi:hypothetical protein
MRVFDVKQVSIQPAAVAGAKTANPDFFAYLMTVDTYYQIP